MLQIYSNIQFKKKVYNLKKNFKIKINSKVYKSIYKLIIVIKYNVLSMFLYSQN